MHAIFTTNSYDTLAVREMSKLEILDTRRNKLDVRLQGWIGSCATIFPHLVGYAAKLAGP